MANLTEQEQQELEAMWAANLAKLNDLTLIRKNCANRIDAAVIAATTKTNALLAEYQVREAQSIAFKAGGYVGVMGDQLNAYSVEYRISPQIAADTVLAQANGLRYLLGKLGEARMKKGSLNFEETAEAIETKTQEILGLITSIASQM